jgi:homogentisate 1,2-dioxygenase
VTRKWMPVKGAEGTHSRQAHADLPEGTYEREVSKEGFFGPAAFFYHRRPPTGWSTFEGPLRPQAFDLTALNASSATPFGAPVVLQNGAVEMRFWKHALTPSATLPGTPSAMALARDADGDLLVFIHQGEGELFCDYGRLLYQPGDYLYLPRGTMWRLAPASPTAALTIEARGSHFSLPDRGMLGPTAVFDPAMLQTPVMDEAFRAQQDLPGEVPVFIKKRGQVSVATYPYNPLDAVGWHGDLAPVRLNVKDIRPVVSARYHLPPSVHTTFVADRFVVCTFTPRPFETDPGAIKVPFFHNNDDFDEVIFYHAGDFFSRDHIEAGMMTFHPSGFTHGPHPKALSRMLVQPKAETDEYAVMIDARDPLEVGEGAAAVENPAYVDSWKTP